MRLFVLFGICILTLPPVPASAQDKLLDLPEGKPLVVGQTYTLQSAVMGAERKITIRLPTGYAKEPERKYDVIYVIDGGPEQDFPHIAGIAQSRDMNWTFKPFILVGIETVQRRAEISPAVVDPTLYKIGLGATPGGSAKFRKFIAKEVKPWVEARLRTSGHDGVIGESLAGLFIVETLFEMPDLFDDYIAISPSMWWEKLKYGREAKGYLDKLPSTEKRLYLTIANEGYDHRKGILLLVDALKNDAPDSLKWTFVPQNKTETHGSIYHGAALDAFRAFYGMAERTTKSYTPMSGDPIPKRTAKQQARLDAPCTPENTRHTNPQETSPYNDEFPYECIQHDYGPRAEAGNFTP